MAWAAGRGRFRRDSFGRAAQLAIKVYACEGCGMWFAVKPGQCSACGRMNFIRFDSKAEAARFAQLELMQAQGLIRDLARQVRFPLYAAGNHGPMLVGHYVADFTYSENGKRIIEDLKGNAITDLSAWKVRHMEAQGFPVKLVKAA